MTFLKNIGLMMTYRCQIACPHCIVKASPNRKEEVNINDAYNWIDQIATYNNGYIQSLSLTGGEPFYNLNKLKQIAEYAGGKGLLVSVVSNAYWATSIQESTKILKQLSSLSVISFSTDVYHQKSIPLSNIKNAVKAAKELNIPTLISVCTENRSDQSYQEIINKLSKHVDKKDIQTVITFKAGRANMKDMNQVLTNQPPKSPCQALNSPILFPNGDVMACIGPVIDLKTKHQLRVGNLKSEPLSTMFEKLEQNPIIHTLRVWGPKKLIELLKTEGYNEHIPVKFVKESICDLCFKLMSNTSLYNYFYDLVNDSYFREFVAYAQAYYLKETTLYDKLKLNSLNNKKGGYNECYR